MAPSLHARDSNYIQSAARPFWLRVASGRTRSVAPCRLSCSRRAAERCHQPARRLSTALPLCAVGSWLNRFLILRTALVAGARKRSSRLPKTVAQGRGWYCREDCIAPRRRKPIWTEDSSAVRSDPRLDVWRTRVLVWLSPSPWFIRPCLTEHRVRSGWTKEGSLLTELQISLGC